MALALDDFSPISTLKGLPAWPSKQLGSRRFLAALEEWLVRFLATVEKRLVARRAQSSRAKSTKFKPDLES
jgi:hypothetical protein